MLIIIMKQVFECDEEKNQEDPKWGKYQTKNHGYSTHRYETSKENVVMYYNNDMRENLYISFKGLSDSIASAIW